MCIRDSCEIIIRHTQRRAVILSNGKMCIRDSLTSGKIHISQKLIDLFHISLFQFFPHIGAADLPAAVF